MLTLGVAVLDEGATAPATAANQSSRPAGVPEIPAQACSAYAASSGDDANPGTRTQPVKNLRTLTLRLQPGQTGCLKDDDAITLDPGGWGVLFGGTPGHPKVLRPETPGHRSTVTGPDGFLIGKTESDLMLTGIDFRRTGNGGLLTVDGDRVVLDGIDLTNSKNICLGVGGDARAGEFDKTAEDFALINSRIHDCGSEHLNDPLDVGGAHGAYLKLTRDGDGDGRGAVIYNTLLDHNKDRGLQLYPDADDVWADHIVLIGNGANLNFGSELPDARSERARISHAIIADSRLDFDDPVDPNPSNTNDIVGNFAGVLMNGADNIVSNSCLSNTVRPGFLFAVTGGGNSVTLQSMTLNRPPSFVNADQTDYRLAPGSECQGMGLADASLLPYGPQEPPAAPTAPSVPRSVTAVAGDGSAVVAWMPPENPGTGIGLSYTAMAHRAGDSRDGSSCQTTASNCTITGLNNLPGSAAPYTFTVVAENSAGSSPISAESNGVRPQATISFRAKVTGTARVEGLLAVHISDLWPAGSSLTYQWLRNSSPISGAVGTSYAPTSTDVGKSLEVRVEASKTDYVTATIVAPAEKIAAIPVRLGSVRYVGALRVGKKLMARVEKVSPSSAKVKYRWYRNSRVIPGASGSSYRLRRADAGKRITLRVSASAKSYLTTNRKYTRSTKVGFPR